MNIGVTFNLKYNWTICTNCKKRYLYYLVVVHGLKSGLGTLNLLCIAAEMLLFNNQKKGLKLALVEELEAHLHPQYQLRLICLSLHRRLVSPLVGGGRPYI